MAKGARGFFQTYEENSFSICVLISPFPGSTAHICMHKEWRKGSDTQEYQPSQTQEPDIIF